MRRTLITIVMALAALAIPAASFVPGSASAAPARHKNNVTATVSNPGLGFKTLCDANNHVQIKFFAIDTTPFDFTGHTQVFIDGTKVIDQTNNTLALANDYTSTTYATASALGNISGYTTSYVTVTGLPVFGDYRQDFNSLSC